MGALAGRADRPADSALQEATPAAEGDETIGEPVAFSSPSGNVGRYADALAARCDIAEFAITCRDSLTGHGFAIAREFYDVSRAPEHGSYEGICAVSV